MRYSKFGNTEKFVSALGFGALRLPARKDDPSKVDEEQSVNLMRTAFDLGVNYVDTSFIYRGGQSEKAVGLALRDGYRNKVYLSTKISLNNETTSNIMHSTLETQLKRMDTDYIDFYHFHGINKRIMDEIILKKGLLDEMEKAKNEGIIKHICFSFHDEPEAMKYIIDKGEIFESVLCQYNLLDRRNESEMEYAKSKGLGIAIMGPLAGGKFIIPSSILDSERSSSSPETALRFVFSNPNVDCVLSGMKTLDMVRENVAVASKPKNLTPEESMKLQEMIDENRILADLYCTECGYCLPCPLGINIPYVFRIMNLYKVDGLFDHAKNMLNELLNCKDKNIFLQGEDVPQGTPPDRCVNCGICKDKCPQKLKIPEQLRRTIKELTERV